MDKKQDTTIEALMKHLIEHGPGGIATVSGRAFELAVKIARERFLDAPLMSAGPIAGLCQRLRARAHRHAGGMVAVDVPGTADHDGAPFHPQSLERGCRSVRAVMLAVAEIDAKGVSTREAEAVMREFGIESPSSSQVSRDRAAR